MLTLHSYVLRELVKTFVLTQIALAVLFIMAGGLYNVVRSEGVAASDLLGIMHLLIPTIVTLTMPMAALFSATMIYGRLAADNELLACRAAGINVHRMLLSAVLLAAFVAAFTMLFGNFIIPGFTQQIERYVQNNLRDLLAQKLQHEGFVHRGKGDEDRYTVTAERVQLVSEDALREKDFPVGDHLHYLLITNPTFLHVDQNSELKRFSVAEYALCMFDTARDPIEVTLHVRNGRDFAVGERAVLIGQQQIGPIEVPLPRRQRLSTADLRDLLRWRTAVWDAPRVRENVQRFRLDVTRARFYEYCADELRAGRTVRLRDEYDRSYVVSAGRARLDRGGLVLTDGRVEVFAPDGTPTQIYKAARVDIETLTLPTRLMIEIRLRQTDDQDVLEYDPASPNRRPRNRQTFSVDQVLLPEAVLAEMEQVPPSAILDPGVDLSLPRGLSDRRIGLQKESQHMERKLRATINMRLAYTLSVLVTLIMGAALGIMFRGARALAAVALAMIPLLGVVILLVFGRQLTEDAQMTNIGPYVTWGSLVLMLAADGVVLHFGVRR